MTLKIAYFLWHVFREVYDVVLKTHPPLVGIYKTPVLGEKIYILGLCNYERCSLLLSDARENKHELFL